MLPISLKSEKTLCLHLSFGVYFQRPMRDTYEFAIRMIIWHYLDGRKCFNLILIFSRVSAFYKSSLLGLLFEDFCCRNIFKVPKFGATIFSPKTLCCITQSVRPFNMCTVSIITFLRTRIKTWAFSLSANKTSG